MAKKNLKRLPVVDARKRLVGMLESFRYSDELLRQAIASIGVTGTVLHPQSGSVQTVADVMDPSVSTVSPGALLSDVLAH